MKNKLVGMVLISAIGIWGCGPLNNTQKGGIIGTASGGAVGAVIGKAAGNTGLGAIIGATVGGVTGIVIGSQMDKQAEEIKKEIPDAKVVRVNEGIVIEFSDKVLFDYDKSKLNAAARNSLDKLIVVLKKYPDTNIEIQGHTDNSGTEKYNQSLSLRRANAVSKYLRANAIGASRLTVRGLGESIPKYDNTTESGQVQNRRVEFLISANEKMKADAAKDEAMRNGN